MNKVAEARANFKPNLRGLAACTAEARIAALDNDPGPPDPDTFDALLGRMQTSNWFCSGRQVYSNDFDE